MNILHITSILPAPLERKKTENDILIRIAEEYQKKYPDSKHYFLLILPYSNAILSILKKRWKEYYSLLKDGVYKYKDFDIQVIGIPAFKYDRLIRSKLSFTGHYLNKHKINQLITEIEPDIIHAHNFKVDLELAKLFKKKYDIDYMVTARNLELGTFIKLKKAKLPPSKILSLNYQNFTKCKNNIDLPSHLISHPVDNEFFVEPNHVNKNIKFISVCRLIKFKNLDKVIIALSKINKPYVYDIYGSGPEENNLKELVMNLNLQSKVKFKGWVSHNTVKINMSKYDLFLQPSFPETLGRVYFEAMASGVPVLASKGTGVDGIIENGEQGYLIDHKSIECIHRAINNYFGMNDNDKLEIKKAAYFKMLAFNWDSILEKYNEFYKI